MNWDAWTTLGWQAWLTLSLIGAILVTLVFTRAATDVVLVGAMTVLLVSGVLKPSEALAGLANEAIVTIAVLYVVVAGLEATGGNTIIAEKFLGRPKTVTAALTKMMFPVTFVSAFMNNTPVVAMFLPAVNDWAKQNRLSVSKLMIPLSYAAVLSGVVTIISTNSNMLVNGMLMAAKGRSMHMFELTWIGIPITIVGVLFMIVFNKWLLPDRRPIADQFGDPREYSVEMVVEPGSVLVGKTIEQAGLRQLPNAFLAEIERGGEIMPAVGPQEKLRENDHLVFVGVVESVIDLQRIRGLKPATDQIFKLEAPRSRRTLIEAVVSPRCPIIGQTIRDGRFRSIYNAVIIAVARSGERINKKIGDIVLQPGDTLLVEAHPSFAEQQRNSRHFYLVSKVEDFVPVRHDRAFLAVGILLAMIIVASFEWVSMLKASMLAAGAMLLTRCCTSAVARRSVEWKIIVTLAAAFGVGAAVEKSGLAKAIAESLTSFAHGSPFLSLTAIYGGTLLLTELISHGAAVSLLFPIALQTANQLGIDYMPFVAAVTVAGSLGFATPLSYQTHMMVYGPGGYHFKDFLRAGIPMDLLCWGISMVTIPLVFPLHAL
ncbi:MAG: SLC13 family permease [Planctomycetes bacterium]|nr:SLC13 family permease [Planctomycetota bacterium]MBI3833237.1 SLC13 family permease [Planctomycetota bacterium]